MGSLDIVDNNATTASASGVPDVATVATVDPVDCVNHGAGYRRHKKKVSKIDACLLNDTVVFPWLRTQPIEL
jgi:hypothetical protein